MIGLPGPLRRLGSSLTVRVVAALLLVGLLPVGLAWRVVVVTRQAVLGQLAETHALAARSAAESVGEFLASRLTLASGLALHPALSDPTSDDARSLLAESLQAWSALGVRGIALVNGRGEEILRAQLRQPEAQAAVAAAIDLPPDRQIVFTPDPTPTLRLEAPLPQSAALLWLVVSAEQIDSILETYELGQEAELVLLSPSGNVLQVPEDPLFEDLSPSLRDQILSPWLAGKVEFSAADGARFIGAHAPVPNSGWSVFSRQPAAAAERLARRLRVQAISAVAGAAGLVALLTMAAYRTLIRPIRQIAAAQRRLAGPGAQSRGGDEIEQLRDSFSALQRRIEDQEELGQIFLGRYQVLEVVGSGAMGTVFKGWDPRLKRTVALKTVRLDRTLGEKQRRELMGTLMKEAVTGARFSHPNVVAIYDVEDRPDGAFIAMEFVDGVGLDNLLWRQGRLTAERVIPLGAAIARGLAAAHREGVVHRDVKPANILLGRDHSIKVTDFGIADLVSSLRADSQSVFGTPGYLPPETLRGDGYGPASDLFSLGVILYYSLTGVQPFEAKTVKEIIRKTLFGILPPPRSHQPAIPDELDALVMALLEKTPGRRPPDASELADRLEAWGRSKGLQWRLEEREALRSEGGDPGAPSLWVPTTRIEPESASEG